MLENIQIRKYLYLPSSVNQSLGGSADFWSIVSLRLVILFCLDPTFYRYAKISLENHFVFNFVCGVTISGGKEPLLAT